MEGTCIVHSITHTHSYNTTQTKAQKKREGGREGGKERKREREGGKRERGRRDREGGRKGSIYFRILLKKGQVSSAIVQGGNLIILLNVGKAS